MNQATLLLAFSAGMVAAINPCGFALLPAYLSYYLGLESADDGANAPANPLGRGLAVGGAMTAGVMIVFGIIGAFWSAVSEFVGERLPWVIVGLGVLLVILGIAMIAGFVPMVRLPKLATSSGSQSAWSAFVFGVSYGVASLSCTIGPFIGTVSTTFSRHDAVAGVAAFLLYGLGMGAIITFLTLAVSFARQGVVSKMRGLLPHMGRISGVLLVLSGLIAAYYGIYEARVLTGGDPDNAFAELIADWRDSIARWISDVGAGRIGLAIGLVVIGAVAVRAVKRRHPSASESCVDSSEEPKLPTT